MRVLIIKIAAYDIKKYQKIDMGKITQFCLETV